MITTLKNTLQAFVNKFGYKFVNMQYQDYMIYSDKTFMEMYLKCKPYTMTSIERMYALYRSVNYVINAGIPGDFVECGVWKGGSSMLIAYVLIQRNVSDRQIWLYDTFEGMTQPTAADYANADPDYKATDKYTPQWCYAAYDEVVKNMPIGINYQFIKGRVEDTIPEQVPDKIALLRLDTDWYESTKHELICLYPRLEKNGVLIIDDYGCWAGSQKAVDEYFSDIPILFTRIDDTGIVGVKI